MVACKQCACCGKTLYEYDEYTEINSEVNCKECVTGWSVQDFLDALGLSFKQVRKDER